MAYPDERHLADAAPGLTRTARNLGLTEQDVNNAHRDHVAAALDAATADGQVTEHERDELLNLCRVLGVDPPALLTEGGSDTAEVTLWPGMFVCFTGDAADPDTGNPLPRSDLKRLARAHGLEPVDSVTKKRCNIVAAADPTSMSGKTKKARDYGAPVISVPDFLKALKEIRP